MLRNKYRAFEIKDNQVSQTLVDGNLCSIAEFIRHCSEGSIITLHTMEGEPFLIGLSKMFVFCGDKAFLDRQLIPYLRSMGGESVWKEFMFRTGSYFFMGIRLAIWEMGKQSSTACSRKRSWFRL